MTDQDIVRCADICDDNPEAQIVELMFNDYAGRPCFHGEAVTFSTYEDNKGILDEFLPTCFVTLCNVMKNAPDQVTSITIPGRGTPIDMTCQLAAKAFELARDKDDEIEAMSAVGLLNGILENVPGRE